MPFWSSLRNFVVILVVDGLLSGFWFDEVLSSLRGCLEEIWK